jgi:secreted PhoX family phosphatase
MTVFPKNHLTKAILLAAMASTLAACGGLSDDGDKGVAGTDGAAGTSGVTGTAGTAGAAGSDGRDGGDAYLPRVEFSSIPLPVSDSEKQNIQSTTSVTIDGVSQDVSFTQLMATGDQNNGEVFGLSKDIAGAVIQFEDASNYICNGTNDGVGSGLDYVSILQKHDKLFMVAQFECQVGSIYSAELEQTAEGVLSVKTDSLQFVDQSAGFGGWVHCAGQTTPWQSHLGSEEYEPDAASVEKSLAAATATLTGSKYYDEAALYHSTTAERATGFTAAKEAGIQRMSPYFYGWTPEVNISDVSGATEYKKHFSMGRFSHELSYVMPDNRTVYMSDDGTNVGLFMFIADQAKDLSAGTLYAAKWVQTSDVQGGRAMIDWVNLGHADNAMVKAQIDKDLSFSDVFDSVDATDNTCPATYSYVAYNDECLRVKDIDGVDGVTAIDEALASRLETRRYAIMKGATAEFRKEEGITFDADHNTLYVAMSELAHGMEDHAKYGDTSKKYYDLGGSNDIRLPHNVCGGIYALDILPLHGSDTNNKTINSRFVVGNMNGILTGTPDDSVAGNACDVNGISNPDNVTYLQGSDLLVIGEDTSKHENNMVWAYNVVSKKLTRILSTPLDAETTSPFWHKDVNGFGYMTVVSQHPMDDVEGASDADKENKVGVLGPFNFTQLQK